MPINRLASLAVTCCAIVLLLPSPRSQGAVLYTVRQLTSNSRVDSLPQVFGSSVVWQGQGGSDSGTDDEIFHFNGTSTTQMTANATPDRFVRISSGGIVWGRGNSTTQEIIYHNGASESQLTTNAVFDGNPSISGSRIAWEQGAGTGLEVMQWNAGITSNLSSNAVADRLPNVNGNTVVWTSGSTPNTKILLNSGAGNVTVTSSTTALEDPKVSGSRVVWEGFAGGTSNDREIYTFDGSAVTRLSTNAFPDFDPQVSGNMVVWWGGTFNNFHIYMWDGALHQLSTGIRNQFPQISGNNIVWQGFDGNDDEIFLWNGSEVTQITNNSYADTSPQISGNHITWVGQFTSNGTSAEIFDAIFVPEPQTWALAATGLLALVAIAARQRQTA